MLTYAKSVSAGLAAATVVVLGAWAMGLGPHVSHHPVPPPRLVVLSDGTFTLSDRIEMVSDTRVDYSWKEEAVVLLAFIGGFAWTLGRTRRRVARAGLA